MSAKSRWQQIGKRRWAEISPVWVDAASSVPSPLSPPDPGLNKLHGLLAMTDCNCGVNADVEGLRVQVFWEALFLYAKCDHAKVASERLASLGMPSWAMFNAYHSAFLGAKSIIWLLGAPLPDLAGKQSLLDIFYETSGKQKRRASQVPSQFYLKRVPKLDQRAVWACLKRVIRQTEADCFDAEIVTDLLALDEAVITPPRNHFLYKPEYWLFDDLTEDFHYAPPWVGAVDQEPAASRSFLFWLCFAVHRLLSQLFKDLASSSRLIKELLGSLRSELLKGENLQVSYVHFCERN